MTHIWVVNGTKYPLDKAEDINDIAFKNSER